MVQDAFTSQTHCPALPSSLTAVNIGTVVLVGCYVHTVDSRRNKGTTPIAFASERGAECHNSTIIKKIKL